MNNLLEFLSKNYHWLLFVFLEAASVVLLFSYNGYQGSVWFSSANSISGKILEWDSEINSYFALSTVNDELTQRNVVLEQQVAEMRKKLAAATGDSTYRNKQIPIGYKIIPAKVVQITIDKDDNLITINKGSADGVKKNMGVVSGNGVVGIVYLVGPHYSVVIPLLSSQSNISCTIRHRGYFGYLRWFGGDSQTAFVEDVPRHARYNRGDTIETSGYSSVFPQGIMVGRVIKTTNSTDGLSYRIHVKLATDFSNLRDVCVVDNSPMKEQLEIIRAAEDSIANFQNSDKE